MDVKLRALPKSPTWYDYKMAIVGTLLDYKLSLRVQRVTVTVYAERHLAPTKMMVFKESKKWSWQHFYEDILPKLVEEHGTRNR